MPALKLFVSHSSRLDDIEGNTLDADHNWQLLEDTCTALRSAYGNSIEILVDQDNDQGLVPACDWEKRLNEWLAECHAAIILFSRRAKEKSYWVQKEATILSWRRELDDQFKLIPILLEGQLDIDDLDEGYLGSLRLSKSQMIRSAQNATQILNGIKQGLGEPQTLDSTCYDTPLCRLEKNISRLLVENVNDNVLEEVWQQLNDVEKPHWHPACGVRFAAALARYLVRNGHQCLQNFKTIVNKISPAPPQQRSEELLSYIRCLWIDPHAAALIRYSEQYNEAIAVAVNGQLLTQAVQEWGIDNYTLERYRERAWMFEELPKIITPGSLVNENTLLEEIRRSYTMGANINTDLIDDYINSTSSHLLVFILVSEEEGGVDDREFLQTLKNVKNKFNKLVFVLGTGEQLPELLPENVLPIKPDLDTMQEQMQYMAELDARLSIKEKYR